jgi:site-specific DNA recombinase
MVSSSIPVRKGWEFLLPKEKILRAALYRRLSDEEQRKGYSLTEQYDALLSAIYADGAILKPEHDFVDIHTAKYWRQRKKLQEMIAAAKRHEFDRLYIIDLDRFARNLIHQEIIREELLWNGVEIISLNPKQNTRDDTPMDTLERQIFGWYAEQELVKIRERTSTGIKGRLKEGHLLAGRRPLYGYSWVDKWVVRDGKEVLVPKAAYIIKTEEAEVVIWIFEKADHGVSLREIARILTQEHIPTPDGKEKWHPTTVANILSHPFYTGQSAAFRHKFTFIPGKPMQRQERPEEEWVKLPGDIIPPLVTKECFDRVQKRLVYNKQYSPRNNRHELSLLRCGIVVCGYCQSNMSVQHAGPNKIPYYRCNKARKLFQGCKGSHISAKYLDDVAWEYALNVIAHPERVQEYLETKKIGDPVKDDIAAIDRLLEKTISKIVNLTETLEDTPDRESRSILTHRLKALAEEKQGYEMERDDLLRFKLNWQAAMRELDEFKVWCYEQQQEINHPDYNPSYADKRRACEMIGIKIYVYRKGDRELPYEVFVGPPEIMEKISVANKSSSAS